MYEYRTLTQEQKEERVAERLAQGFPAHAPPHPLRLQTYYLLTATCYEHQPYVSTSVRRQQLLDLLFEQFTQEGLEIRAWVVLPNHYHLLTYVDDFDKLSRLFRRIHGSTARQWNQEDQQQGRKVWYRYADRAIRSERHYYTTLNYLHYNPVKHGYVASPYDWKQSSVGWYLDGFGREWLRDCWVRYPVRDYGKGWDDGS
ncbi:MAG: transposase [Kamptonema sp. SIO4C4]|nr:transposase [Kamptonema sp. SIO4C4]